MDNSGAFARCEQCGVRYARETLLEELQKQAAAHDDLEEDAVERLLIRAQQRAQTGALREARELYQQIIDERKPDSSGAWFGLLETAYLQACEHIASPFWAREMYLRAYDAQTPRQAAERAMAAVRALPACRFAFQYASPEQSKRYRKRMEELEQRYARLLRQRIGEAEAKSENPGKRA